MRTEGYVEMMIRYPLRKMEDQNPEDLEFHALTSEVWLRGSDVNLLAKSAAEDSQTFKELELTEELTKPNTEETEVINIQETTQWMRPIIQYLEHGILPQDKLKDQKLKIKPTHYSMHNGELYRRSLLHPWSKCVSLEKGNY